MADDRPEPRAVSFGLDPRPDDAYRPGYPAVVADRLTGDLDNCPPGAPQLPSGRPARCRAPRSRARRTAGRRSPYRTADVEDGHASALQGRVRVRRRDLRAGVVVARSCGRDPDDRGRPNAGRVPRRLLECRPGGRRAHAPARGRLRARCAGLSRTHAPRWLRAPDVIPELRASGRFAGRRDSLPAVVAVHEHRVVSGGGHLRRRELAAGRRVRGAPVGDRSDRRRQTAGLGASNS